MTFSHPDAELFIPDSLPVEQAVPRTTHLGVGAHQDDLEFMALGGILKCFQSEEFWFGGVTCTNGAGSARTGPYASFTDAEMQAVRKKEQRSAAIVGQYSFMAQLSHPSSVSKKPELRQALVKDLESILLKSKPSVVYTHNPFDKHATHIGVFKALLDAIHRLPEDARPAQLIGCEVWRCLDWLPDKLKVVEPLDAHPNLAAALNGVFDSQITGGKRYDLAVEGRRLANATFFDSHSTDESARVSFAIDLSELISGSSSLESFCESILEQFKEEVIQGIQN